MTTSYSVLEGFTKNWWGLLLKGILAILFGVMTFLMPGLTLLTLALLFGAYALIDGVLSIWLGASSRAFGLVLFGLLAIGFGIYTLYNPLRTAVALLYLIGAWAILRGIFEIVTAIQLRKEITNEWSMAFGGVLSIAVGLLFFAMPGAGALAVAWIVGAYVFIEGVALVSLAMRLRKLPGEVRRLDRAA